MSLEWVPYFMCGECRLERSSPKVSYDRLGYAVYPGYGAETRPTAATMADVSTPVDR